MKRALIVIALLVAGFAATGESASAAQSPCRVRGAHNFGALANTRVVWRTARDGSLEYWACRGRKRAVQLIGGLDPDAEIENVTLNGNFIGFDYPEFATEGWYSWVRVVDLRGGIAREYIATQGSQYDPDDDLVNPYSEVAALEVSRYGALGWIARAVAWNEPWDGCRVQRKGDARICQPEVHLVDGKTLGVVASGWGIAPRSLRLSRGSLWWTDDGVWWQIPISDH